MNRQLPHNKHFLWGDLAFHTPTSSCDIISPGFIQGSLMEALTHEADYRIRAHMPLNPLIDSTGVTCYCEVIQRRAGCHRWCTPHILTRCGHDTSTAVISGDRLSWNGVEGILEVSHRLWQDTRCLANWRSWGKLARRSICLCSDNLFSSCLSLSWYSYKAKSLFHNVIILLFDRVSHYCMSWLN